MNKISHIGRVAVAVWRPRQTDLKAGAVLRSAAGRDLAHIRISVPAVDFVCLSRARKE